MVIITGIWDYGIITGLWDYGIYGLLPRMTLFAAHTSPARQLRLQWPLKKSLSFKFLSSNVDFKLYSFDPGFRNLSVCELTSFSGYSLWRQTSSQLTLGFGVDISSYLHYGFDSIYETSSNVQLFCNILKQLAVFNNAMWHGWISNIEELYLLAAENAFRLDKPARLRFVKLNQNDFK